MSKSKPEKISLDRPVVLIGMMGAGKSSVGRALAELLGAPFYDSDAEIEAAAGRRIPDIFAEFGEPEFRRMERLVVARLLGGGPCVLSLGGGAFIDPETRARVKKDALSVWLKVDRALLLERVLRHGNRPLLQGGDPAEKLNRILSEREPVYAQADVTVACDDASIAQNAQRVLESIAEGEGHAPKR